MNIVKLKDVIMPDSFKMADFFNKELKGKYAYWIQMRYIFPLDSLCYHDYIKYEQMDPMDFLKESTLPHIDLYSEDYCMIDFANMFIDLYETEEINDIYEYKAANEYSTDADIEISKIRMFRTWLASELLKFNNSKKYSVEVLHMLEYYKNGMYNEVLKYLEIFGGTTTNFYNVSSSCDCCNTNSNILSANISTCDSKKIYIDNIHKLMVKTFEEPAFWMSLNKNFIKTFKKYIDNIIKVGLTINFPKTQTKFVECNCNSIENNSNNDILSKLSISLGYIIDEDTVGHINYIHNALYNWAEYLYDYMYWEIK